MPGRQWPADRNTKQPETFTELVERLRPVDKTGRHRRTSRRPVARKSPSTATALATSDTVPLAQVPARRPSRNKIAQITMISTAAAAVMLAATYEIAADRAGQEEVPEAQRMTPAPTVPTPPPTPPTPPPPPPSISPTAPTPTAPAQAQPAAALPNAPRTATPPRPKQRPGTIEPISSAEQPRIANPLPGLRCEHGHDKSPKWWEQADHRLCVGRDGD